MKSVIKQLKTATKQYVHPKSRRHYSTALKIKGGEGERRWVGTTSQITFRSVNVRWQMDFFFLNFFFL